MRSSTRGPSVVLVALALMLTACAANRGHATDDRQAAVASVLNSLHDAASKADESRYFNLFAPDAIFYGTDDAERWTKDEFRAYAHPFFSQGKGWTYTVADRQIYFASDRRTAWFDERLDNAKWGRCRGSGVLILINQQWQITQYNLTVPIPNDLLPNVSEQIRSFEARQPR